MSKILYFDHAATTAVYPELNELIVRYNSEAFYNPSALYDAALEPNRALVMARSQIAQVLGVKNEEIYFTSCATESNNWVLRSVCLRKENELVTTCGEHAAVRETAKALSARGNRVTFVPLQRDGRVDEKALFDAITSNTKLISMIHVSNETGAINDIAAIAREIKQEFPNILIHSDGVQAFCKTKAVLKNIDFYSMSAHKIHAPKGIGALYIKKGSRLAPLLTGGGQEKNMRSGTENISGIAAFGAAASKFFKGYDRAELERYRDEIIRRLQAVSGFFVNVSPTSNVSPHVLSCGFEGIQGETLMHALSLRGVVIGMGSACSAHSSGNSVLSSMGIPDKRVASSVRISLDVTQTMDEIVELCETVVETVQDIKEKLK